MQNLATPWVSVRAAFDDGPRETVLFATPISVTKRGTTSPSANRRMRAATVIPDCMVASIEKCVSIFWFGLPTARKSGGRVGAEVL